MGYKTHTRHTRVPNSSRLLSPCLFTSGRRPAPRLPCPLPFPIPPTSSPSRALPKRGPQRAGVALGEVGGLGREIAAAVGLVRQREVPLRRC